MSSWDQYPGTTPAASTQYYDTQQYYDAYNANLQPYHNPNAAYTPEQAQQYTQQYQEYTDAAYRQPYSETMQGNYGINTMIKEQNIRSFTPDISELSSTENARSHIHVQQGPSTYPNVANPTVHQDQNFVLQEDLISTPHDYNPAPDKPAPDKPAPDKPAPKVRKTSQTKFSENKQSYIKFKRKEDTYQISNPSTYQNPNLVHFSDMMVSSDATGRDDDMNISEEEGDVKGYTQQRHTAIELFEAAVADRLYPPQKRAPMNALWFKSSIKPLKGTPFENYFEYIPMPSIWLKFKQNVEKPSLLGRHKDKLATGHRYNIWLDPYDSNYMCFRKYYREVDIKTKTNSSYAGFYKGHGILRLTDHFFLNSPLQNKETFLLLQDAIPNMIPPPPHLTVHHNNASNIAVASVQKTDEEDQNQYPGCPAKLVIFAYARYGSREGVCPTNYYEAYFINVPDIVEVTANVGDLVPDPKKRADGSCAVVTEMGVIPKYVGSGRSHRKK